MTLGGNEQPGLCSVTSSKGNGRRYSLDAMDGPHSQSLRDGEEENLRPCWESNSYSVVLKPALESA